MTNGCTNGKCRDLFAIPKAEALDSSSGSQPSGAQVSASEGATQSIRRCEMGDLGTRPLVRCVAASQSPLVSPRYCYLRLTENEA